MRLYQRWQRTKSRWAAARLAALGVSPAARATAAAVSGAPAEAAEPRASILARLQLGLEALYRVETRLDVDAFVIDERASARQRGVARAPREQLLVRESDEELSLALFVDAQALENLERHDPAERPATRELRRLLPRASRASATSSTSRCARRGERRVSALELELQAEVDKFACCVLLDPARGRICAGGCSDDVRFARRSRADERERYRTANDEADRYAGRAGAPLRRARPLGRHARRAAPLLSTGPGRQAGAHQPRRAVAGVRSPPPVRRGRVRRGQALRVTRRRPLSLTLPPRTGRGFNF